MKAANTSWRSCVAAAILTAQLVALLAPSLPRAAQAQAAPSSSQKPPVQRGQEYYDQSRFDEAIGLLRDLVDQGTLTGGDLTRAREILARSYVKKGYPAQGKEMFKAILRQDASYRPDPIKVPPDETAVFEQALTEFQSEQGQPAKRDTVKVASPPSAKHAAVAPGTEGKKSIFGQWWFWAGSAVLVGGIAAAAAGGGGSNGTQPLSPLGGPPPAP